MHHLHDSRLLFRCKFLHDTNSTKAFYARKQLLLSTRLSHRNSVCLPVRLSIRLSVTRVDQSKRCKLGSPNLYHRLPGRL